MAELVAYNGISAVKESIAKQIADEQITGSFHWHMMRRAGLAKKCLIARYQITQLVELLGGKEYRKYRKHFNQHRAELRTIEAIEFFSAEGKNQYNEQSAQLSELLVALQESAEKVAESTKDFTLKKFGSKSKAVVAEVDARIGKFASEDDAEAIITEHEEAKVA